MICLGRHHKPNKSHAVMPKNTSVAIKVDLAQQNLLNQMEICTEQLHENDYFMQTHFPYVCSSDESESDIWMIFLMLLFYLINLASSY